MLKLLKAPDPEDLFVQRYDLLMGWALALTNYNEAQAEDLVHDAFIQFTLRSGSLATIENTDAYLNRMLRNMYLSQIRRAAVTQETPFSIANFDSAEMGLRRTDQRDEIHVQDELRQICQYACARKETSKAGCVLILRFFHGYYPSEIAQILRTTRKAANQWLQIARREAKVYLTDPSALKFAGENPKARVGQFGYAQGTVALLSDLRQTIFAARHDECSPPDQLKALYREKAPATIDAKVLSHIASCATCLDEVNRLLGIPLLSERGSAFAPRLGAAYMLRGKQGQETVLRGGFGVYYDLGAGTAGNGWPFTALRTTSLPGCTLAWERRSTCSTTRCSVITITTPPV